jgi:hypothetical protein
MDFLSEVEASLLSLGGAARFENWCFGLVSGGGSPVIEVEEGTVLINLCELGVDGIEDWNRALAERMTVAASEIMGWAPYFDDRGVSSWNTVGYHERFAAVFWRSAFAPIEWMDLRRIETAGETSAAPSPSICRQHFPALSLDPHRASLLVRPGGVELWALWSNLQNPPEAALAAERVAGEAIHAITNQTTFSASNESRPWTDTAQNITRLMTNAGWYAKPGFASACFSEWANRYSDALCSGQLLSVCEPELLPIAALLPAFRQQKPFEFNEQDFIRCLSGSRLVFATAFAEEIELHYTAGRLNALWRDLDIKIDLDSLTTVLAPMSVWPYYPDENWSKSFEALCTKSAESIERHQATMFVAACGAYGLPLVHEMHKRYRIPCICNGHLMNVYFGMATSATMEARFFKRNPGSENWLRPDLTTRYPEISRIDNGRYVQKATPVAGG